MDLLLIIGSGRLNFYGSGSLKDRGVCGFPIIIIIIIITIIIKMMMIKQLVQ